MTIPRSQPGTMLVGLALLLIAEIGLFAFTQSHDPVWLGLLLPWIFGEELALSSAEGNTHG